MNTSLLWWHCEMPDLFHTAHLAGITISRNCCTITCISLSVFRCADLICLIGRVPSTLVFSKTRMLWTSFRRWERWGTASSQGGNIWPPFPVDLYFQLLSHKESLHLVRLDSESKFGFYTILNATVERVPLHASPTFCPAVLGTVGLRRRRRKARWRQRSQSPKCFQPSISMAPWSCPNEARSRLQGSYCQEGHWCGVDWI